MPALDATDKILDEIAKLPGPQKVRYTHDAMINCIIANPAVSQNDLAKYFGYSAPWISQIIASDAFQARLSQRTEELVDPTILLSVKEQFNALVLTSLAILREKLKAPNPPDNLVLRSLEVGSRALGYGARDIGTPITNNVNIHLDELGKNLVNLLQRKKAEVLPYIEGETI
jgi:hypothetical protein